MRLSNDYMFQSGTCAWRQMQKNTKKILLTSGKKMCGNESPYNAVAQNLVESALRQRKVNTGAFGHDRLLVNTRPREYYSLLHTWQTRLLQKEINFKVKEWYAGPKTWEIVTQAVYTDRNVRKNFIKQNDISRVVFLSLDRQVELNNLPRNCIIIIIIIINLYFYLA